MRVVIVGAGTIGQWFATVTAGWLDPIFLDIDQKRAETAAERYDGDVWTRDSVEPAPVVCTAVPLTNTTDVLAEYLPFAELAVIDLSGAMQSPLQVMNSAEQELERISLHPLFAPENAPGNIAAVIEEPGTVWSHCQQRLANAGNHVFETTPEEHDQAMETVQAKVHAAIMAYALAADPVDSAFHTPISEELDRLAKTVLTGSPRVYADIQTTFDGAESVAQAAADVARADNTVFVDIFYQAQEQLGLRANDDR